MYTYNLFCYGLELAEDKEFNNFMNEEFQIYLKIGKRDWEVNGPYHGGQVNGDLYSTIFGTIITDDDGNSDFIEEVRNAKESDYIDDYNEFIRKIIEEIDDDIIREPDFREDGDLIKEFIKTHKPKFYTIEVSS